MLVAGSTLELNHSHEKALIAKFNITKCVER